MKKKKAWIWAIALIAVLAIAGVVYSYFYSPTRVLVVNALPSQEADIALNNDCPSIKVDFVQPDEMESVDGYDAILLFGRNLHLDSAKVAMVEEAAQQGVPVFTTKLRHFNYVINRNITEEQADEINAYFKNPTQANYRNLLRYIRHLSTPEKLGYQDYELAQSLPKNIFYHLEPGKFYKTKDELTDYLKKQGLYHPDGENVAFVSGVNYPVEGNRAHVDTLLTRLTAMGYNVYPIFASEKRPDMIKEVNPRAIVYLPMGRPGNDSLLSWLFERDVPIFMPFPLINTHEEWLDPDLPITGGSLNARVLVPETAGALTPMCLATQNPTDEGYLRYCVEPERMNTFLTLCDRQLSLREKSNKDKKLAIAYFKSPGKDALVSSGMETVPSLYNFLCALKKEGYNLDGFPTTLQEFQRQVMTRGWVPGDYAQGAQQKFMDEADPIWIDKATYENWAHQVLLPEKYDEVVKRYGRAPGHLLARGDSLCFAALRYGNILLFPQPRPALGDDEFKLVHGAQVAPPHSYLAPYLYMQCAWDADALIHFGTHGNLEFTPGKNVALSQADWADALVGARPHFYFYTTGNVGESVIAKRRTRAEIVTYLTPPYVESGMRQRYSALLDMVHQALSAPESDLSRLSPGIKRQANRLGISRDLDLDSNLNVAYAKADLEKIDVFAEEIANEKITGAYYVMGKPYSASDHMTTMLAVMADKVAYEDAKADYRHGKINTSQLHDFNFVNHHYLKAAREKIKHTLSTGNAQGDSMMAEVQEVSSKLKASAGAEIASMLRVLNGGAVAAAPGGDPVRAPNVLPMGRNMYSINTETTPDDQAWKDGARLADETIVQYRRAHNGEFPQQIAYTFWAGEFINSKGATVAQALRMLGVEPVRDDQGRVIDLKLTPSEELGRPRVNVMVQVSGQLRDVAASRLMLITQAVELASNAMDDFYPNYVAQSSIRQEDALQEAGMSLADARKYSTMRVFGPINSGYSTGMLAYTETSGAWDDKQEIIDGYINNMSAIYGTQDDWGKSMPEIFKAAMSGTDVVVQPRQSNTWGPMSLDHVYEFTGGLSLVSTALNGHEPDAMMADYRNANMPRMQDLKQGIAVETRSTILNPDYVRERMKGDATTAQNFGELFRNVFGWNVMRPSALDPQLYDELYDMYVADSNGIGVRDYFDRVNPAAFQEMTATMLESARKGYWSPTPQQLVAVAKAHAEMTAKHGAPCTEFTCSNPKLTDYVAKNLQPDLAKKYQQNMLAAISQGGSSNQKPVVLTEEILTQQAQQQQAQDYSIAAIAMVCLLGIILCFVYYRRRRE